MRQALRYGLVFAIAVALGHVATILASPTIIMDVAMNRLSEKGRSINVFRFADRTTSASRQIVRPSPDLAYASCVYDLSSGPVLLEVAPTPNAGYVSVSVFASNTDNIAALDSASHPGGIRFILQKEGEPAPSGGAPVVYTPTTRGIILDRRLAPTAAAFTVADKARRGDSCAPLG